MRLETVWKLPQLNDAHNAFLDRHPPCVTFRQVVVPLQGPGQSPVLPFACCVGSLRSVGRCGRCSCWCRFRVRGAQSLVCWGCAGCCGGRLTALAAHAPPPSGRPPPASPRSVCVRSTPTWGATSWSGRYCATSTDPVHGRGVPGSQTPNLNSSSGTNSVPMRPLLVHRGGGPVSRPRLCFGNACLWAVCAAT